MKTNNKKKTKKTLSLTTETLRRLDDSLRFVRGGMRGRGCDPCGTNPTICE